jgi:amino acid transporter
MALVLLAAVATYAIPTVAGLYGGAGENGKYLLWGQEEASEGQGIGPVMQDYGIDTAVLQSWGVDPASPTGWEFPQIAHAIGEKTSGQKDGPLAGFLGTIVMASAVLSMIGLFIGNGLGGTRIPFALAEDGMMPKWLVKVHPKYGTPWIAILFCGLIYSIFTLQAFSFLVVVDVFLNMLVLMMEFAALWVLRIKRPDIPRKAIPGGYWGLALATLGPTLFVAFAIYSQVATEGFKSIGLALAAMVVGAVVYGIMFVLVKPGVPDVNPFVLDQAEG